MLREFVRCHCLLILPPWGRETEGGCDHWYENDPLPVPLPRVERELRAKVR